MDVLNAVQKLGALAQGRRLEAFRLLVSSGPDGLPAGDVARGLGVPHNTMSSHLAILENAGLIASRRAGRSVIYTVRYDGTKALLAFLMEDCCRGRPDVCAPALDSLMPGCCPPNKRGKHNETSAR